MFQAGDKEHFCVPDFLSSPGSPGAARGSVAVNANGSSVQPHSCSAAALAGALGAQEKADTKGHVCVV